MPSTTPRPTDPTAVGRRRDVVLAGHVGDHAAARAALTDPAPPVRATALGALVRLDALAPSEWRSGLDDAAPEVRRRACELGVAFGDAALEALTVALGDGDDGVAEAAAWAIGEVGSGGDGRASCPPGPLGAAVTALAAATTGHRDPLVREAAVAALGAIGDDRGLAAVLAATADKPAVRRRAVLALAAFDGDEVDDALRRALVDRDWQVRQAAEDLGAQPAG